MNLSGINQRDFVREIPAAAVVLFFLFLASQVLAGEPPQPWPARPIMSGDWQYASQDQVSILRSKFRIHVSQEERMLLDGITRLRALPLSCHEDAVLFEGETRDSSRQSGVVSFLLHKKGITLLDGKSDRLHALNAWSPVITRTKEQAETYLKLFVGSLIAEEGNFRILQTPEEIVWKDDTGKESHQEVVKKMKPLELQPNGDSWKGTGVVQYGKHLFVSTFSLAPNGKVEMPDDDTIGENLPIAATRYAGSLRYERF